MMVRSTLLAVISGALLAALAAANLHGASQNAPTAIAPRLDAHASLQQEIQHAIDRGLDFLRSAQNSNGWWSTPDHPAVSALALSALLGDPAEKYRAKPPWLQHGYAYLTGCAREDGGIHREQLVTYNTALSVMALLAANEPRYEPMLRRARQFLVELQRDFAEHRPTNDVFVGGIGYGSQSRHSDMGNTLAALEALYHTRHLALDKNLAGARDLDWGAAIRFLQNCQNLPGFNRQTWIADDPANRGGFVYYPGHSMAGTTTNRATGRVALRSYGSISYAGLLSYIYADLERDDPRVRAVFDWLRDHYTLDENPGMGRQGLFYYFHTMTKALTAYGVKELITADGRVIDWRHELVLRLFNLQQRDGSWANDHGRWWEKDPVLVTSYVVLSLSTVQRSLSRQP